jgi:hypothetical protein
MYNDLLFDIRMSFFDADIVTILNRAFLQISSRFHNITRDGEQPILQHHCPCATKLPLDLVLTIFSPLAPAAHLVLTVNFNVVSASTFKDVNGALAAPFCCSVQDANLLDCLLCVLH